MNELIARAMAERFDGLRQQKLLTTVAGLVKTMETDAYSGDKNETRSLPVPYTLDSRKPDDWKVLLPDPQKSAILYFEDGGYTARSVGGLSQVRSRITMVCWFNGERIKGVTRERLTPILLGALTMHNRRIPTTDPGLSSLQVTGYAGVTADPFAKYTALDSLFNFRIAPYGWLAIDFSLTAYASTSCLI